MRSKTGETWKTNTAGRTLRIFILIAAVLFCLSASVFAEEEAFPLQGIRPSGQTVVQLGDDIRVSGVTSLTYTGKPLKQKNLKVELVKGKKTITLNVGTDYRVTYTNNTDVGKATLKITGKGNYSGTITATFRILPVKIAVPAAKTGLVYNGRSQIGVAAGKTYTVTNGAAVNAGTYKAKLTLKDPKNYRWTDGTADAKTVKWTIGRLHIKNATVQPIGKQTYTGKPLNPSVTVTIKLGGKTVSLKEGTDFTVAYGKGDYVIYNITKPGTANYTVYGTGNYTGSRLESFRICDRGKDLERLWELNRYSTSAVIGKAYRPAIGVGRFPCIIVACGSKYPDALSGAYLGVVKEAPILLMHSPTEDGVEASQPMVREFIRYYAGDSATIYLLGGESSIGLLGPVAGRHKIRLGGADRYETNLLILEECDIQPGQEFVVATGTDYKDALTASGTGKPLLLVRGNGLTYHQQTYLKKVRPSKFTIIGTTAEVSEGVQKELAAIAPVSRITGADAYTRSVAAAKALFPRTVEHVNLCSGENFADGLCGGPMTVERGGPLILVNETAAVSDRVRNYVKSVGATRVTVFGGPGSVSDTTVKKVMSLN